MPIPVTLLIDSREQKPWQFEVEEKTKPGYKSLVVDTKVTTISAGDYSLEGFEDQIVIERKSGFCELWGNHVPVSNKQRFEREMEKLRDIRYKYLLVESNVSNDILGLSVGQMRFSPPTSVLWKWLNELSMEYGIHVMLVGDTGKRTARMIFENFIRRLS